MSANCEVIIIFPICGQFGAIGKPDSGRLVRKTNIFIKNKLKTELKISLNLSYYWFE